MDYISVNEAAKRWNTSERSVRNYCAQGRVDGAFLTGKTWNIPADAQKPDRANRRKATLLETLSDQMKRRLPGGIYHKVQIELTYNSNHIEGSKLTHDQTRYIFETNTVGVEDDALRVDDIVETANHFRCIDLVIARAAEPISEALVKQLHFMLKNGTSDSRKGWFAVGEYKKLPNTVGDMPTSSPADVAAHLKALLKEYNSSKDKTLDELLDFHCRFERIHPFQDGNGRVGRLLLFKECLRCDVVPFIIDDDLKLFYYRGLKQWDSDRAYLRDTCLAAQDKFKAWLDYFGVSYTK